MRWIAEGITELDDLEPWIFWIVIGILRGRFMETSSQSDR